MISGEPIDIALREITDSKRLLERLLEAAKSYEHFANCLRKRCISRKGRFYQVHLRIPAQRFRNSKATVFNLPRSTV